MQPIVSLVNVTKIHKKKAKSIQALHNISLDIMPGETVAITGESGSGKSSLLNLIGCLDKPTDGEIIIDGTATHRLGDRKLSKLRNKTIGFIFQFFHLQPYLTLADNIAVPTIFSFTKPRIVDAQIKDLLHEVNLDGYQSQYPHELSGGQVQRAAVARALINNPKLLLADEPTGNLDSANADAIISLLLKINRLHGTTLIVVTHDQHIAARMQRQIHLSHGEIIT